MLHPEPPAREGAADGVRLLAGTSPQTARDARWASMDRLDKREAGADSLPNISHLARREAQVPLVRVRGQAFVAQADGGLRVSVASLYRTVVKPPLG